jgi:pyridoxamine 5'-phosphate oxidase
MTNAAAITPPLDPWVLFREWYARAEKEEPNDPNAMALATVGAEDTPSVRMVLFKDFGENGFTFYTNYESLKGLQLSQKPVAALCLHWKSLRCQVRAEGPVVPLSAAESDAYFATRSRESRIGAWASHQSRVLAERAVLEEAAKNYEKKFDKRDIPRPSYWGGYCLTPLLIEFWQDRPFRLHDRVVYRRANLNEDWRWERLYP